MYDKERKNAQLEHALLEHTKNYTMQEFRALRDLMLLYEESNPEPAQTQSSIIVNTQTTKFKAKSKKFPNLNLCPEIWTFLTQTIKLLKKHQMESFFTQLKPLPKKGTAEITITKRTDCETL